MGTHRHGRDVLSEDLRVGLLAGDAAVVHRVDADSDAVACSRAAAGQAN